MADYAIHDTTLESIANTIRKKDGTSALIDPATYAERINLMGMLPEKTASSASVCSFFDGADDVPMSSVIAHIGANLTGVSEVEVTQTGKNLFDKANANVVDGYISTTAFSTGNANAKTIYIPIKAGETYTVSKTAGQRFQIATAEVIPSNGALFTNRQAQSGSVGSLTITAGANDQYLWAWVFLDGTDTGNLADMLASVQIEYGSTATEFEQYKQPTTYTANLGRTVYGADVDLVSGQGSENCSVLTSLSSLAWNKTTLGGNDCFYANLPNGYIGNGSGIVDGACDSYTITTDGNMGTDKTIRFYFNSNFNFSRISIRDDQYASYTGSQFKEAVTGNIVYQLAESARTDFTFDGQEIPSMLGVNNLWHDDGQTECTYRADIDLALAQSSGTRGLMMASRSVSPMIGEEASLDRENILEEVSDYSDNEKEVNENEQNESY